MPKTCVSPARRLRAVAGRGLRFSNWHPILHLQESQMHVLQMHPSFRMRRLVANAGNPLLSMVYGTVPGNIPVSGGCILVQVLQSCSPSGREFGIRPGSGPRRSPLAAQLLQRSHERARNRTHAIDERYTYTAQS
jgi:hypothetical protein